MDDLPKKSVVIKYADEHGNEDHCIVVPLSIYFYERQTPACWMMWAFDVRKEQERGFVMSNIRRWTDTAADPLNNSKERLTFYVEAGQKIPKHVRIMYVNWRGEKGVRTIVPLRLEYTETEYHKPAQWIMHAFDVEKEQERGFAMIGVSEWAGPIIVAMQTEETEKKKCCVFM